MTSPSPCRCSKWKRACRHLNKIDAANNKNISENCFSDPNFIGIVRNMVTTSFILWKK